MPIDLKSIIEELREIEASAEVLQKRCYILRKKLEGESSPSSSRKGKVLSDDVKARVIAKRRSRINK